MSLAALGAPAASTVIAAIQQEYPNSPRKIDAVASDALAYEARADAIAAGWTSKPAGPAYIRLPR